ncbi:hypothetical protein ACFOZ1_12945 [Gracilibacillus marinus]|uniref:Uncharacterized protein n=1 Tax=Gracilibacillus marinus TaxID=630535 RepID=A0ABV8VYL3_9BACI
MKKKWLSILFLAIFSTSVLTACAEDGDDTENPEQEENQTEENTDDATEEEATE